MSSFVVKQIRHLNGQLCIPGDKSITHRSIILSALTRAKTILKNFPSNKDCLTTVRAFRSLGIKITLHSKNNTVEIVGRGLNGLRPPRKPIEAGDSGTTFRLLLGVLAGCGFQTKLLAGKSLSQRPMLRVTEPLRMMGAEISARRTASAYLPSSKARCSTASAYLPSSKARYTISTTQLEEYPPITIKGGNLKPITYKMPVASAQVKSAILLAGIFVSGKTEVVEPMQTRDHTERMLKLFKADITRLQNSIIIKGKKKLTSPGTIIIPGDISSASFFMVLAALLPDAHITIKKVSLNASRIGIIKVLKRMKANIKVTNQTSQTSGLEPVGNIVVKNSKLKGTIVRKREIPSLIDELPVLMVAAALASGVTIFESVEELRVKETDRIKSMVENLGKMGASIRVVKAALSEKIVIQGKKALGGGKVKSFGDHRTAMSMVVAGLLAEGQTVIEGIECINKSFPGFLKILNSLITQNLP